MMTLMMIMKTKKRQSPVPMAIPFFTMKNALDVDRVGPSQF